MPSVAAGCSCRSRTGLRSPALPCCSARPSRCPHSRAPSRSRPAAVAAGAGATSWCPAPGVTVPSESLSSVQGPVPSGWRLACLVLSTTSRSGTPMTHPHSRRSPAFHQQRSHMSMCEGSAGSGLLLGRSAGPCRPAASGGPVIGRKLPAGRPGHRTRSTSERSRSRLSPSLGGSWCAFTAPGVHRCAARWVR